MKKEDFMKLGLSEVDSEKCAAASSEELKGFIPKSRFDEVNTEKKAVEATLAERNTQLEDLKKVDAEKLQEEIQKLQKENKAKDEVHANEIKTLKVNTAVSNALNTAKAKNVAAVKALLKLDDAELLEDGTIKGLSDQIENLTKSEDTSFLFNASQEPKFKGVLPGEGEGTVQVDKPKTYEDFVRNVENK